MHISTIEGAGELLADVLEDYTAASMMVDSHDMEKKARSKLQTLITLLVDTVSDLRDFINCNVLKTK